MRVTMRHPIPWSAVEHPDGTAGLVITSGPHESLSMSFESRDAMKRFGESIVKAAVQTDYGPWQSPQLRKVLTKSPGCITGTSPAEPDLVTESLLRDAGFLYNPSSGWFGLGF